MTKDQKTQAIQELKEKFDKSPFFYITDSSSLTVAQVNQFRRICYDKGVEMMVVKNTLAKKALESLGDRGYESLYQSLEGPTSILFTETASLPAKIITDFRKTNEKPIIKAANIDTAVFTGDAQLKALVSLKSKEDLVGDIIMLLQSPAKNVISALKSGGNTIAGLVKALEERASN